MTDHPWQSILANTDLATQSAEYFIAPLTEQGVIELTGPDTATYLQGQISCDVNQVVEKAQLGCCCNIKGRVQTIFHLFTLPVEKTQQPTYYLSLPLTMVEKTLARLKQYAMFSKVTIAASEQIISMGCYSPQRALSLPTNHAAVIELTAGYYEIYAPRSEIERIWQQLNQHYSAVTSEVWHQQRIRIGLATIYPDSYEQFLPHDLNLHCIDGLNFNKGCYTGQEIISRMHYRAKLKNHMHLMKLSADTAVAPTTALLNDAGKTVGQVVDCCHGDLLAIVNDNYLQQTLTVAGHEALTLTLAELPYEIA
ncbi:MAG: folate-binding protein YgfZ [Gammaproteobacteria bacterium]|nr:folate-binding protein YgfZ [Gammaproteobacteria bacterium]